jgi:hypothetical protein
MQGSIQACARRPRAHRTKHNPQAKTDTIMEAERINALSALLNDLTSREAELRRYL